MSKTSTALVCQPPGKKEMEALAELERVAGEYSLQVIDSKGRFQQAIALSVGMSSLRQSLKPFMPWIMTLQGSPLGFLTDKDKEGGYPEEVVSECLIESVLRGLYPVRNEFNIIARRQYTTLNGFSRLIREFPGLSNFRPVLGLPAVKTGGAVIPCSATWCVRGKADALECEIPVRMDKYSGADQLLGKARRKLYARVYSQLTGSELDDGDTSDEVRLRGAGLPRGNGSRSAALAAQIQARSGGVTPEQIERVKQLAVLAGFSPEGLLRALPGGVKDVGELSAEQADEVCAFLETEAENLREPADEGAAVGDAAE